MFATMKKAFLFLTALIALSSISFAADNAPIEETFNRYWSAYSKKDFAKAAADVLPADLEAAKSALLPVFLAAQGNTTKEAQEIVTAFFGRTVGKARESLTPADVFAGLNRIAMANNPDMFEMLKDATTSIVFVRRPNDDDAEVHFQVSLRGAADMDSESLTKKNGRWWVRLNEDPQQLAANFKALFTKQG
jgi:hypothetical protein